MATHRLYHKTDEIRNLLKSIEDTIRRAKALLDQSIKKKIRRENVKEFSLSEALKKKSLMLDLNQRIEKKPLLCTKSPSFS